MFFQIPQNCLNEDKLNPSRIHLHWNLQSNDENTILSQIWFTLEIYQTNLDLDKERLKIIKASTLSFKCL